MKGARWVRGMISVKGVRDGKSVRDKGLGLVLVLGLFAINSDLECLLQIQT